MSDGTEFALLDRAISDLRHGANNSMPPAEAVEGTIRSLLDAERADERQDRRPRWFSAQPGFRFAIAAGFFLLFSGFTAGIPLAAKYVLMGLMLAGLALRRVSIRRYQGDPHRWPLVANRGDFSGQGILLYQAGRILTIGPLLASRLMKGPTSASIVGIALFMAGAALGETSVNAFGDPQNRPAMDWLWRLRRCFRGPGFVLFCAGEALRFVGAFLAVYR